MIIAFVFSEKAAFNSTGLNLYNGSCNVTGTGIPPAMLIAGT